MILQWGDEKLSVDMIKEKQILLHVIAVHSRRMCRMTGRHAGSAHLPTAMAKCVFPTPGRTAQPYVIHAYRKHTVLTIFP